MYVVCQSDVDNETNCYIQVMQDTCSASAADVNMLLTLIYFAKLNHQTSCALGESSGYLLILFDWCNLLSADIY